MKLPKRYIEDFYGGKGCDFKVREVYPPEPSSSACDFGPNNELCAACDLYPEGNTACDFEPNSGNESCDFSPEESNGGDFDPNGGRGNNSSSEAVERGPNTLSKEIKSVSALVRKHNNNKEG